MASQSDTKTTPPSTDALAGQHADKSADSTSDDEASDRESGADIAKLKEKPELAHYLEHGSSILAIAVGNQHMYVGTQDGEIVVYSMASFEQVHRTQAHTRAVLCLFLAADGQLLFSSAGDAIVNVWCPTTLKRRYHLYSTYDVGDVFSVAYSSQFDTVYLGAQNTSIQWCSLAESASRPRPNLDHHPDRRNHRFFDSVQHGGTSTPRAQPPLTAYAEGEIVEIDKGHMRHYAHFGYVYCMLMARGVSRLVDSTEDVLISGGGDGTVKLWKLFKDDEKGLEEIACLGQDDAESVLSMAVDGSFLYSSKLQGIIELWDLDTKQKLRVIRAHRGDVMTLQMGWGYVWSAGSTGFARKYSTVPSATSSQVYQCVNRWKAHEGRVLTSAVTTYRGRQLYLTGGSDNAVSVWDVTGYTTEKKSNKPDYLADSQLVQDLKELVSFKTISSRPDLHAEDCRRGATFLRTLFKKYGAQTESLSNGQYNPIIFAKFSGKPEVSQQRKKILFYGHYDVVNAEKGDWVSVDPFDLKGLNGYLYGRGVSDNKGPIMAALYAVVDLVQEQSLDADVVFLVEGEEESGSRGFKDVIKRHKNTIGGVDYIILANSYWIDDVTPCLTYGLRGVLHLTVKVESEHGDVHSGVDGSVMMDEPLFDLTAILARLKGKHNHIAIPGFYDGILPLSQAEQERYNEITEYLISRNPELGPAEALKASLLARWAQPNLTIHRYKVSGPEGSLVSSNASAAISFRLCPNQEVEDIIKSVTSFLQDSFDALETNNRLTITVENQADAWLGVPESEIFRTFEDAIMDVWGNTSTGRRPSTPGKQISKSPKKPTPATSKTLTGNTSTVAEAAVDSPEPSESPDGEKPRGRKPLYIREGGSIPSIRFLEKEFDAPAAHFPVGQASDSAHLNNERLRVTNLYKAREIFRRVFKELPKR